MPVVLGIATVEKGIAPVEQGGGGKNLTLSACASVRLQWWDVRCSC